MSSVTSSENGVADEIGFSAYFDVVYVLSAALFYGTLQYSFTIVSSWLTNTYSRHFSSYLCLIYPCSKVCYYLLSIQGFIWNSIELRQRARNSKSVRFLLFLTYLTFFSTTGQFITNVGETLTGLSWSQTPSDTISYLDRMARADSKALPYGIASLVFQVINVLSLSSSL